MFEHEYRRFPFNLPGGLTVTPVSHIIYQDGSTVKARNGNTGAIDYSGTDASTVIQAAINALPSLSTPGSKQGLVFIQAGEYNITTIIDLYSRMTLMGEGRSTYLLNKVAGGPCLRLNGTSADNIYDVLVAGLTIEGSAGSGHGIYALNATNLWLRELYITLNRGSGVLLEDSGFSSIDNCSIESNSEEGLYLLTSSEIRVLNCGIKSNTKNGIFASGGNTNTIIGNQISRNVRSGLNWQALRSVILGNIIFSNNTGNSTSYHGIILAFCDDSIVALNKIRDNGSNGYAINISNIQSQRNRVIDNILTGSHKIPPIQDLGEGTVIEGNSGYVSQRERVFIPKW